MKHESAQEGLKAMSVAKDSSQVTSVIGKRSHLRSPDLAEKNPADPSQGESVRF